MNKQLNELKENISKQINKIKKTIQDLKEENNRDVESLKIINLKYKVPYSKYISQSKA
jgi:gas vesicle protein